MKAKDLIIRLLEIGAENEIDIIHLGENVEHYEIRDIDNATKQTSQPRIIIYIN